jgi:hypothetical protein
MVCTRARTYTYVRTTHVYVHVYVYCVCTNRTAKYAGPRQQLHPVTGGRVNKAARDWLDALTAPEPGEQVPSQDDHPWNPQARTTTETVLREEAMQALVRVRVRVQAHNMLARRMMVEIRAAGLAVELDGRCTLLSAAFLY